MDAKEKKQIDYDHPKRKKKELQKRFWQEKKDETQEEGKEKKTVSRFDTKKIKRTRFENIFLLTMKQF